MMTTRNEAAEREEIEALLPWFATGSLNASDTRRVERALASDQDLARRLDLVREELAETIHLNETLGAPSARVMARLFEKIDAEAPAARRGAATLSVNLTTRISSFVAGLSPRTLAWSGAVAVLAIILQAGIIAGVLLGERGGSPGGYRTVSREPSGSAEAGSFVMIRFAPQASAADITKFLEANKAIIAGGPAAGTGMYRVRVAVTGMAKEELARVIKRLQEDKVVGFAAPAQ